jgi:flavin-dependent dehydrogenase
VIFAFPTNDGLSGIFVGWPIEMLPRVRADIDAHFAAAFDEIPELAERVRCGRREERFGGATDLPNFYRKPCGPGWALVGDAGCHKDPYLALGICDAFRDVEWLVEAIDTGLSGRGDLLSAMQDYETRRNDASRQEYWQNLSAARFIPPPEEVYRIRAAVRGNLEATTQFFLAQEGMIPRDAFFNPENLGRLLGTAVELGASRQRP